MKKIPSMGLAISMAFIIIPSALAAAAIVTTEPTDGFTKGGAPEWSATHETAPSDAPDHRAYHRDAVSAHTQWHIDHKAEMGTRAYAIAHRKLHQERNLLHRLYHIGLEMKSSSSSRSSRSFSSRRSSSSSSWKSNSSSSRMSSSSSSMSSQSSMSSSSSSSMSSSSTSNNGNTSQAVPALGAASTYAVLAGSTVTNTGLTNITGDVGVSAGSAVTGFPPGVVSAGAIHAADLPASNAQLSLTVAYNDLAGRSVAPVSVAGNIGGKTLAPGLYKSTSSLSISSGDLTLDAKGNGNSVWVFQIASTLDVTVGRHIVLAGNAKPSNIFWQVGTSATIGTDVIFKGSIFADQSISLLTGANVDGRLLARIGAVTLQGNTVTVPTY